MQAQALKSKSDFNMDGVRTQEFINAIQAVRLSIAGSPAREANKWAVRMSEVRGACNKLTDEEIHLYECAALSSWESR